SAAAEKPAVLVYAEPLLARSMTFISTQAEALTSFSPHYISPHYLREGLPLPWERVVVMRRGQGRFSRLTELPFKVLGVAPFFVRRLRRLRPVLLHAHFGFAGLRALPLARTLGIPLVVTFQGCDAIVLFTGRLDEKKGCEYLIRAMAKVQSESPHMELMVIGDGPLRPELEQLAAHCLRKYRFLGFQPREVVKHWMNRARMFGAPSIRARSGDAEGYPNA